MTLKKTTSLVKGDRVRHLGHRWEVKEINPFVTESGLHDGFRLITLTRWQPEEGSADNGKRINHHVQADINASWSVRDA